MERNFIYDKIKIGNTYINPSFIEYFQIDQKTRTILIHFGSGSEFLYDIEECSELLEAFSIRNVL